MRTRNRRRRSSGGRMWRRDVTDQLPRFFVIFSRRLGRTGSKNPIRKSVSTFRRGLLWWFVWWFGADGRRRRRWRYHRHRDYVFIVNMRGGFLMRLGRLGALIPARLAPFRGSNYIHNQVVRKRKPTRYVGCRVGPGLHSDLPSFLDDNIPDLREDDQVVWTDQIVSAFEYLLAYHINGLESLVDESFDTLRLHGQPN